MTLEEPPADTTIFLSTVNKYDLLPTILSRCIVFKLNSEKRYSFPFLEKVANMYESWLNSLNAKTSFNLAIIEMYKILGCIEENFDAMANEMGMAKPELLKILIACLEQKTAEVFKRSQRIVLKLHNCIEIFEKKKYFLSINCNIIAYLETCFILLARFFERNLNKSGEYDNGY
jgi:DNA polymerase III delta prime subunit